MAKLTFKAGTTSKDVNILIQDSSVSTGAGKTGIAYNTSGLTAYYHRQGSNAATAITLATKTLGTWATGGFVEVSSANMPGLYELGIPDAALASGATWVVIMLFGVANMAPVTLEIQLDAVDNQDATRGGMTALPNANAAANGGLPTVDANNAVKVQSGTGSNQISLSSGLVTLAGVTHTGAVIPTVTTVNGLASGVITATSIAADAITDAKVASDVTIASVTGAVGSVTGNVGGNVAGSVGSVTTVSDKTGYSLSSGGIQAIWDALTSALTTSGSVGKLIVDYLNASISSIADLIGTPTAADLSTDIAALQADTDDIQTRIPAGLNSGNITAHVVSIANNAITAAAIATDAIDADALAADAVTEIGTGISVSAPTVEDIDAQLTASHGDGSWLTAEGFATPTNVSDGTATVVASIGALNNLSATQVWAAGTRTLTSGSAPTTTEIWTAATRTLTSPTPGSTTPPAVSGTTLSIKKAVSFDVDVTGMTIPANWTKIYWTVKTNTSVADSDAVLQVVITNGGDPGDGLIYLNGAAATGHEDEASLTVDQPGGTITISITDDYTAEVSAATPTLTSDFKAITDVSKSVQLAVCPVSISSAVTLAVS